MRRDGARHGSDKGPGEGPAPDQARIAEDLHVNGYAPNLARAPQPAGGGKRVREAQDHRDLARYFGNPGPVANIGPGQTAAVNVSSSDACQAAQAGQHRRYRQLRIWLPGRGHVDVRANGFDLICGVFVSRFGVPADQPRAPRPSPLTARIMAAATVRPGEDFTYTVTLANPTTSAYSLRPCPAYEEYIIANAGLTKSPAPDSRVVANYYLNCATVHQIGAHGSVTYQMRLKLPTGFPAGPVKFVWLLHGGAGPGASAPLKVTGKS
jgi:hypothetical protein